MRCGAPCPPPATTSAFSRSPPDGDALIAGGIGGAVHHWKLPGGEPARPVRGHSAPVRGVCCLPDGGVATAGADGFVVVYDGTGRELRRFEAHPAASGLRRYSGVAALAVSRDGAVLYSAGDTGTDRALRAWNIRSGEKLAEFVPPEPANAATALVVSPDGKAVAAAMRFEGVRVLDPLTLKVRAAAGGEAMRSNGVGFLGANRVVSQNVTNGTIGVWEADSGTEVRRMERATPKTPPTQPGVPRVVMPPDVALAGLPMTLAVSPDGTRFTGPSRLAAATGPAIAVWTDDGKEVARLDLKGEPATVVTLTGDGKGIAVGGVDGSVRVFDISTGSVRETFRGHKGPVLALSASADGRHLVSGGADTTAVVWQLP